LIEKGDGWETGIRTPIKTGLLECVSYRKRKVAKGLKVMRIVVPYNNRTVRYHFPVT
jgi:hypothetical protein